MGEAEPPQKSNPIQLLLFFSFFFFSFGLLEVARLYKDHDGGLSTPKLAMGWLQPLPCQNGVVIVPFDFDFDFNFFNY
jgi:hypothetical protein